MATYAQEMKRKYGVPFDISKLRRVKGFKYGDKVRQDSRGEVVLSGIPYGATGEVTALPTGRGHHISDPLLLHRGWSIKEDIMILLKRKFNGKHYNFFDSYHTKAEAREEAAKLKANGNSIRITSPIDKLLPYHELWTRRIGR